jgi:uncharacterized protein YlaI
MALCDGWERVSHEASDSELRSVGVHTKLCGDCYQRFDKDPMQAELMRFL